MSGGAVVGGSTLLGGGRLALPGRPPAPGWLRVAGGRITDLGAGPAPDAAPGEAVRDLAGSLVVPGFIDIHVHGGGGGSYTGGDPEEVRRAVAYHRRHGTTRSLASLVTAPVDDLCAAAARLADLAEDGVIAGIHLEGPFLSAARCGAQDPASLLAPDLEVFARLVAAARGWVKMITIAPELPGALELIRRCADAGVVAAIGHSDATYAQAMAAIDAGARVATHLHNAMRPLHQREPGIALAALERAEVVCEIIADPHHLHPAVIALAFRAAEGGVSLITDAISAAGAPDGVYALGPMRVRVENGSAFLADSHTIAGSTITCDAAFREAVLAGVPLEQVATAAAHTPARVLGIADEVGTLEVGKRADLVVLDDALVPAAVVHAGQWEEIAPEPLPEA